jgi:hypothetical protein
VNTPYQFFQKSILRLIDHPQIKHRISPLFEFP